MRTSSFLLLLTLAACQKATQQAADAGPSVPPGGGPTLSVKLTAIASPSGRTASVHLSVPTLDVDELVGTVTAADMCTMWSAEGTVYASCTPSFGTFTVKLSARGNDLVVEANGQAPRSIRMPAGARLDATRTSLGVRDATDAGCAPSAPVDIRFSTDADSPDSPTTTVLLLAGTEKLPLADVPSADACTINHEADHFMLACGTQRVCTLRTGTIGRVDLSCELPKRAELALQLPCGATGNVPMGPLPRLAHTH